MLEKEEKQRVRPLSMFNKWNIPWQRGRTYPFSSHNTDVESYFQLLRELAKSSGIYAIASIAGPFVTLILAPFLTHSLSRSDYGVLVVLNTIIALVAGITQFGLGSAFFRAYSLDYHSQRDRMGVLSTSVILLLLLSIPVTIVMLLAVSWISTFLFHDTLFSNSVRLAVFIVLVQNLTVPGFAWLRAESRATLFTILSIVNLLVMLSATLVFVGVLHMGINGALLAVLCGYAVILIYTLPGILRRAGYDFRFEIARNLLSFGLPLVSNFVSIWILQLSDRYLLSRLGSLAQTASYSIAYSLGGLLSVVIISPFILAWPMTMYTVAKKENAAFVFRLVFRWFNIVLLFATFGLSFMGIAALDVFFPLSYKSAAPVIPIIALSVMFSGVYNLFTIGVSVQRKTWFAVVFMTVAALVNVVLNFILIPLWGPLGAALSTLLAYLVLDSIAYIVNQRMYPIPFEIGLFCCALFLGIALYIGSSVLVQSQGMFGTYAIYTIALLLYGACLLWLGKLPNPEIP